MSEKEPDFGALAREKNYAVVYGELWLRMDDAIALAGEAYALGRAASVRQEPAQPFVVEDPDAPREPTEAQVTDLTNKWAWLERQKSDWVELKTADVRDLLSALTSAQSRIADLERRLREATEWRPPDDETAKST